MKTNPYLELDLKKIERLGKIREYENVRFRSFLKGFDDKKIDPIVHRLNEEISAQIDCTECGNCCKVLRSRIAEHDIERLAGGLGISRSQVIERYLELYDNELYIEQIPCPFLKDNKCTVYEYRPDDCRSYPHLHKPHFISRLWSVIDNYSICPIVFNVVERLKDELGFRR